MTGPIACGGVVVVSEGVGAFTSYNNGSATLRLLVGTDSNKCSTLNEAIALPEVAYDKVLKIELLCC